MTRARQLSKLGNPNVFSVDTDLNVGVNSTSPTEKLNVVGVVSATSFYGDGSNLQGVASAGLGTALSDVSIDANSLIYYTDTTLGIGSTVVVDPPASTNVAYTQYQEVNLDTDVDLIVAEGDDFIPDILALEDGAMRFGISGSGSSGGGSIGISNIVEDTTPQLGGNLDLNSKTINGNGNININGTFTGDGSGLTNISAVGTGIGVSNNGTNVGTAQTINFGTGITISNVSAGLATVTVSAGSTADVSTSTLNVTGVSTFANAINFSSGNAKINAGIGINVVLQQSGSDKIHFEVGSQGIRPETPNTGEIGNASYPFSKVTAQNALITQTVTAYGGVNASGIVTATGIRISGNAGIITATGHVDSGIVTYRGDSSYSAAGRWVLNASGTDHYTFTGPGLGHSTLNDPTLYLMRGQTYMFENKMGAHPFRIQSTTNGSTGTQWNVGVTNNDVSNGVLIFEVPFECPNTLYYQCTVHPNMGGVLNIVT